MSSRFISAGAIDPTTGEAAASASGTEPKPSPDSTTKPNDEWLAVEKELAAERRRRDEARAAASTGGERSLFEVLQANKEAKQAAFEEANKIKNQFRALDDDEIDFLDEVKGRQREEEDRVRRETEERLKAFREAQRKGEKGGGGGEGEGEDGGDGGEQEWTAGVHRKRKRVDRKAGGLVKRRTVSTGEGEKEKESGKSKGDEQKKDRIWGEKEEEKRAGVGVKVAEKPAPAPATVAPAKPKMGLVSYDSDDSD